MRTVKVHLTAIGMNNVARLHEMDYHEAQCYLRAPVAYLSDTILENTKGRRIGYLWIRLHY